MLPNFFSPAMEFMKRLEINNRCIHLIIALTTIITLGFTAGFTSAKTLFTTWDIFEVDKCASAWLITHHIDTEAEIIITPRGELHPGAIPFDTPTAKFRRYQNHSTYETLLNHYHLTDEKLVYIGKIVHDVEINTWDRKKHKESQAALNALNTIISQSWEAEKKLDQCIQYFEKLAEGL